MPLYIMYIYIYLCMYACCIHVFVHCIVTSVHVCGLMIGFLSLVIMMWNPLVFCLYIFHPVQLTERQFSV